MFAGLGGGLACCCPPWILTASRCPIFHPQPLLWVLLMLREQHILSHLTVWVPNGDSLYFGEIFHGSIAVGESCCCTAACRREQSLEGLTCLCCTASGPGPAAGAGAAQRVWAAPRNCSLGLEQMCCSHGTSAQSCGAPALLHSCWCGSSCPFVGQMCLGYRQDVHQGLWLWRWVLVTCLPSGLDVTRVLTLPLASGTSDPGWSLFARGADRRSRSRNLNC